jgi:hypothetical protein
MPNAYDISYQSVYLFVCCYSYVAGNKYFSFHFISYFTSQIADSNIKDPNPHFGIQDSTSFYFPVKATPVTLHKTITGTGFEG